MEKVFLTHQCNKTKKHTNKLLKREETMITRKTIYWVMNTFQTITN